MEHGWLYKMVIANVTISGAFLVSDRTGIKVLLDDFRNPSSGASIFVIPDENNLKMTIGISHSALA